MEEAIVELASPLVDTEEVKPQAAVRQLPSLPVAASPPLSCCAVFRLSQNPFSETARLTSPYWSASHKQILANLLDGVRRRRGLMVLTAESGTGKTTLLECLGDFLVQDSIEFAFLLNSKLTVEEFYEFIDYDLDLRCGRPSKLNVLRALEDRTTALIVDDEQDLVSCPS